MNSSRSCSPGWIRGRPGRVMISILMLSALPTPTIWVWPAALQWLKPIVRRNSKIEPVLGCRRSLAPLPPIERLADQPFAEQQHDDNEDEALQDGHPVAGIGEFVLDEHHDEGAGDRAQQ